MVVLMGSICWSSHVWHAIHHQQSPSLVVPISFLVIQNLSKSLKGYLALSENGKHQSLMSNYHVPHCLLAICGFVQKQGTPMSTFYRNSLYNANLGVYGIPQYSISHFQTHPFPGVGQSPEIDPTKTCQPMHHDRHPLASILGHAAIGAGVCW